MKKKENGNWIVCLLECSGKSLFCGITNDREKRVIAHNEGRGAKYITCRCPGQCHSDKQAVKQI